MIYLVAPVWMEYIDECRMFASYLAMETYVLTHAAQRKQWASDPHWCNIYAFESEGEVMRIVFQYYIRDNRLVRFPVTRSPVG